MILSDDDIRAAAEFCFSPLDEEEVPRFARAVEAAVLAKLPAAAQVPPAAWREALVARIIALAQGAAANNLDRFYKGDAWREFREEVERLLATREAPAQAIPAAWVEAMKVAREALVEVKHGLEGAKIWAGMRWHYNPLHPFKYLPLKETASAALAQLDALTKEQP